MDYRRREQKSWRSGMKRAARWSATTAKRRPQLCHFYVEGRCNKKQECLFSHDCEVIKKYELCRFYANGFCIHGKECAYMHNDFPCKYYHGTADGSQATTGVSTCKSGAACRFSHEPITDSKVLEAYNNHCNRDALKSKNYTRMAGSAPILVEPSSLISTHFLNVEPNSLLAESAPARTKEDLSSPDSSPPPKTIEQHPQHKRYVRTPSPIHPMSEARGGGAIDLYESAPFRKPIIISWPSETNRGNGKLGNNGSKRKTIGRVNNAAFFFKKPHDQQQPTTNQPTNSTVDDQDLVLVSTEEPEKAFRETTPDHQQDSEHILDLCAAFSKNVHEIACRWTKQDFDRLGLKPSTITRGKVKGPIQDKGESDTGKSQN